MYIGVIILLFIVVVLILCNKKRDSFVSEGVDVVYTWVNTMDSEWLREREVHLGLLRGGTDNTGERMVNTKNPWDEILVSIESVRTYLPWVRNIYVIVQRPQGLPGWVSKKYGVRYVYHDEIYPDVGVLPVYSSQSIETCLHRVPGLSERFIYFNDDTYIMDYMGEEDFFREGMPVGRVFGEKISAKTGYNLGDIVHNYGVINISKYLGDSIYIPYNVPMSMTKSLMEDVEYEYRGVWEETRRNRFRVVGNIVPMYFAINYGIVRGRVVMPKNNGIRTIFTKTVGMGDLDVHMGCFNSLGVGDLGKLRRVVFRNKKIVGPSKGR